MSLETIPDAPTDWERKVIGEVAEVNPTYPVVSGAEYSFLEMAAVAENFGGVIEFARRNLDSSGLSKFRRNDILFGKITPCPENGKVALVKELPGEYGIGSTEFITLSPRAGFDPLFVYYLLCFNPVHGRAVSRMEGSTGRLRITEDTFTKWLTVALPPLPEQKAIAAVLDKADAAVERTRAAVVAARRLKRGLAQALLARGLDAAGQLRDPARQPDQFATTRLGLLPACWNLSSVAKEFDIASGFTLNADRRPRNKKRKYLRVANVQRGRIDLDDVAELEAEDAEFAERQLRLDDLLIVEGHADPMQIGRCARVPAGAVGMAFQNHLYRLRTRGVFPAFADLWLNSERVRRYWQSRCATSSGLNTINQRMLRAVPIPVPPPDEQERIAGLAKAADDAIAATERTVAAHERLKRGLMQVLLTGKVRVPVADRATHATDLDGM